MRIKSYFAKSVNAAIREAREELGPDAMLIESRPAPAGAREAGQYEVVFGIGERGAEPVTARETNAAGEGVAAELKLLRSQIDELRRVLQPDAPCFSRSEADDVREQLTGADFDPDVAASLLEEACTSWGALGGAPGASLRDAVRECIARRCGAAGWGAIEAAGKRVTVFVGPPGAGKTTSLAKIALTHYLARRRSTQIISVDGDRAGSHERLRILSGIAGIAFTAADSIGELNEAIEDLQNKYDVLIDTPGFGPADMGAARELAQAVGRLQRRDVHLVLPATMRRRDLEACAERFDIFKANRVLITRLDETDSAGAALSTALKTGKQISFCCGGQSVPENLEIPDMAKLTSFLSVQQAEQAATAA